VSSTGIDPVRFPESVLHDEGPGGSLVPAAPDPRIGAIPPRMDPELRDREMAAAADAAAREERIVKAVTDALRKALEAEGLGARR
jgi:hypothetical protein